MRLALYPLLSFAIVSSVYVGVGLTDSWHGLLVRPLAPTFADLTCDLAALETIRQVGNPALHNPFDPHGRTHPYGRIWYVVEPTGLSMEDAVWLGPLLGAAFLWVACCVARPRGAWESAMTVLILLSPSVALGVERSNMDLRVFMILAAIGAIASSGPRLRPAYTVLTTALLAVAVLLKYFPLAGLPAMIRSRSFRTALALTTLLIGTFAAYCWSIRDEFGIVIANLPKPYGLFERQGLGAPVLMDILGVPIGLAGPFSMGLGALAILAAWRRPAAALVGGWSPRAESYFLVGAPVWLFCVWTSANYAYRSVFLLLCLPLCFEWARRIEPRPVAALWAVRLLPIVLAIAGSPAQLALAVEWLTVRALGADSGVTSRDVAQVAGPFFHGASWLISLGLSAMVVEILRPTVSSWRNAGGAAVQS